MKNSIFLLFLALFSYQSVLAIKEHKLEIKVIDENTELPLSGLQLLIDSDKTLAETIYSNSKGIVNLNWSGNLKSLRISVYDTNGVYRQQHVWLNKTELKPSLIFQQIRLRKSEDYSVLFAEFKAFDAKVRERNRVNAIDTTLFNGTNELCDSLVEASFIGGELELRKFVMQNLKYPQEAIEMNEQGRVYTNFIVEIDGTLSHVTIERGVSDSIDYESVRLVYSMPKWKPATCFGTAVRTIYRLPFTYSLQ